MPTRDHVLNAIQTTPGKSYEQYKPRKLINNFLKERNTYNNRDDPMAMTDDEEGLSDFIVEDEPPSFESRAKKKGKNRKKEKKRKKMQESSESSSEGMSDFIVEDEPPPSRQRRNKKTKKHTKKTEYSSESESDNKEVSSDFTEEDEESGIQQQNAKKTTKRMKRMLSSSDSESDKNDGVTPSRRSNRISRQPKKVFQKPNKKKAWENILEREPDLRETVDSDDVNDFVVGDEEVEEEVSDAETDVEANIDEDGIICEKSDTEKEGSKQRDDKFNNHENPEETDLPHSLADKLIKTDENLSKKQADIEKETEVRNQSTPSSFVSKKTDLTEAEEQSDDCGSDSECTTVGRKFRSKVRHRRQLSKALDSDASESDGEKINDTFVGRKRRRSSKNFNFDEDGDDSDDDSDYGGGRKEEMKGDEEEKRETG